MVETKMVYKWGTVKFPLEAQLAAEELERINREYNGIVPDDVVRESESEEAILHDCFMWDNSAAAHQYRKQQARVLIDNVVSVVVEANEELGQKEVTIRAYCNISREDEETGKGRAYITIDATMENPEYRKQALQRAYNEFKALRRKYDGLKQYSVSFKEYFKSIDILEEGIKEEIEAVM